MLKIYKHEFFHHFLIFSHFLHYKLCTTSKFLGHQSLEFLNRVVERATINVTKIFHIYIVIEYFTHLQDLERKPVLKNQFCVKCESWDFRSRKVLLPAASPYTPEVSFMPHYTLNQFNEDIKRLGSHLARLLDRR